MRRVFRSAARRRQRATSAWWPLKKNFRHAPAAELDGARVVREVEEPFGEGLVDRRGLAPQGARHEPRHRVDEDDRRRLAAREHVVADGDLVGRQSLRHALVHALVTAADDDDLLGRPPTPRRAPASTLDPAARAARRAAPTRGGPRRRRRLPVKDSTASKIGSGFKTIPSPPPKGRSSTTLCRSCVQPRRSCAADLDQPGRARPPHDAEVEHPPEELGEDGDDVKTKHVNREP